MVATPQIPMTVTEYLHWEPSQNTRYEYVNGRIFAMTGSTIPHNDIALNFYRVQVSSTSPYYYPDIIVSCDSRDLNARKFIQFPRLIIEVISPGSEARDRGEKLAAYRTIPTLQEYVLVDSEKVSVECYRRGEGRMWLYYPYTDGDEISLDMPFRCPIEQLYENVSLDAEEG